MNLVPVQGDRQQDGPEDQDGAEEEGAAASPQAASSKTGKRQGKKRKRGQLEPQDPEVPRKASKAGADSPRGASGSEEGPAHHYAEVPHPPREGPAALHGAQLSALPPPGCLWGFCESTASSSDISCPRWCHLLPGQPLATPIPIPGT